MISHTAKQHTPEGQNPERQVVVSRLNDTTKNGKWQDSRLKRRTGKTVTEIPSCIKQIQCLQKETEVQWIPSHCMVLGNNETANKGTVSMWRLSSHSTRLRRNTKLTFQDTMPPTASKNKGKNGHEQKCNSMFSERSSGKLSAAYHQPCLAAHLQSIYQSNTCVWCRECNSIMNILPGCTVLQSEDSTNCKIILGLQKVNASHLSAQVLNTTTTNKKCSALKIKLCWVMKHQLQVIITRCIITNI
jgi:hypothetical protein